MQTSYLLIIDNHGRIAKDMTKHDKVPLLVAYYTYGSLNLIDSQIYNHGRAAIIAVT